MDLVIAIVLTLLFLSIQLVGSGTWTWLALTPILAWVGLVIVLFFYKLYELRKEKV